MHADLIVVRGRVFRGFGPLEEAPLGSDAGPRPHGGPTAVAVAGGRILAVGDDAEVLRDHAGPTTEVFDAAGGLILAGFDDAHTHVVAGARELDRVDLFGVEALDEVATRVRAFAASNPAAGWVLGRGWLYAAFPDALPPAGLLDALVPDRPAWLTAYDGHTGWANGAALAAAGIGDGTADPPNGEIVRDPATRVPTGVLKEGARALVERAIPPRGRLEDASAVRATMSAFQAAGVTSVQEAWTEPGDLALLAGLEAAGELGVRTRVAFPMRPGGALDAWDRTLDEHESVGFARRGAAWLSAGILKGFADGVIESRTAAMLAPYENDTSRGRPEWAPGELDAFVGAADRRGWQVEIHAIGDAAVRSSLDAFERAAAGNGSWTGRPRGHADGATPRRHRVEHVETIDPADIPRFGRLGVVASMQPLHADPSPNQASVWASNVGPERASRAWAWASIRRAGGTLAFGSDWNVVPFDPILALHAAVNRQTAGGSPPGGWIPGERLSIPAALSAATLGSAVAAFAEHRRGTIAPGLDADLVVLDRDLLDAGPSAIIGTRVRLTVIDGRVVHRTEGAS